MDSQIVSTTATGCRNICSSNNNNNSNKNTNNNNNSNFENTENLTNNGNATRKEEEKPSVSGCVHYKRRAKFVVSFYSSFYYLYFPSKINYFK